MNSAELAFIRLAITSSSFCSKFMKWIRLVRQRAKQKRADTQMEKLALF